MYPLVHLMTACVMLLHALLGCCLHHDHCAAEEGPCTAGAVSAHAPAHSGCSHHHTEPLADADVAPHGVHGQKHLPLHPGPHDCESGDCVFVAGGGTAFSLDSDINWFVSPRVDECERTGAAAYFARVIDSRRSPPPLGGRLHSENCVWLI